MAVDYDHDGNMDIVVVEDRGNLTPTYRNKGGGHFEQVADRIGVQNSGYGRFVEVGFFENVDTLSDGYIVARADLFGNGLPDIVLHNGDPGSEQVEFPPVQVFRNRNAEMNKGLKVTLIGTRSNVDAIGSEVQVTTRGGTMLQQLMGNNGSAQSEKALFFGLGKESVAKEVAVRWPSAPPRPPSRFG